MLSGTAAAPRPPQPQATAHRPSNGTKRKPLASNLTNTHSLPQIKMLVTGLPNLKAPTVRTLSEVSIRDLELAYMNFVDLHWSTRLV